MKRSKFVICMLLYGIIISDLQAMTGKAGKVAGETAYKLGVKLGASSLAATTLAPNYYTLSERYNPQVNTTAGSYTPFKAPQTFQYYPKIESTQFPKFSSKNNQTFYNSAIPKAEPFIQPQDPSIQPTSEMSSKTVPQNKPKILFNNMTLADKIIMRSKLQQQYPELYQTQSKMVQPQTPTISAEVETKTTLAEQKSKPITPKKKLSVTEIETLKNSPEAQQLREKRAQKQQNSISSEVILEDSRNFRQQRKKMNLTEAEIKNLQNSELAQAKRQERTNNRTNRVLSEEIFKDSYHIIQPKIQESHNIQQVYVEHAVQKLSQAIDSWPYYRTEFISEVAHDKILEQEIFETLSLKKENGNLKFLDPKTDKNIIEQLSKKYRYDVDVMRVLNRTLQTIETHSTSQHIDARQANQILASIGYTPQMRQDIFTILPTQAQFDLQTGKITNMPAIETIIQTALENPSAQSYKALQTALKATQDTIYAARHDQTILGDGALLQQLKSFESNIKTTLQESRFNQYKGWSSYLPSTETMLDFTGLKNVTLEQAATGLKPIVNIAGSIGSYALNATIGNMTLSQLAEKTGFIEKQPVGEKLPTEQVPSAPKQLTEFQQRIKTINEQHAAERIQQANQSIANYYTPSMQQNIFACIAEKPIINPKTGEAINQPSIETLVQKALINPSAQTYKALQSALEATKVAIHANRGESSQIQQQLKTYETLLNNTLQKPEFQPFQSWSNWATQTAQSFIPSPKTVLESTGLGDVTVSQALNSTTSTIQTAQPYLQPVINYSGLPNMTIGQLAGVS